MLDAARLPSLSAYLASLPAGIDSYGSCRTKGAIVRSILDEADLTSLAAMLPAPLASLVLEKPPLTAWVPAVLADSVFHLYCDLHAPTDAAMLAWTYERSSRMGRSQAYRHLLAVAGPRVFLRTGARMHAFFQQGTELEVRELRTSQAILELSHPPHLHSRLNQLSNVALLRALVSATGGGDAACEMVERDASHARYVVSWT